MKIGTLRITIVWAAIVPDSPKNICKMWNYNRAYIIYPISILVIATNIVRPSDKKCIA